MNTAKYLGVLLSNDLSWSPHVDNTAHRANQKLGFIRRNLRSSPITSKCLAYTSLVCSGMEYAASIWDPISKVDIRKLEMVQRKAARWAKSCFSQSASVTKMLQDLKWDDLADRRKNIRLTLLYKICNKNVNIEFSEIDIIPSIRPSRRHQEQFFRPRANTDVLKNSFVFRTITEWNTLPASVIHAGSVNAFKSCLTATP